MFTGTSCPSWISCVTLLNVVWVCKSCWVPIHLNVTVDVVGLPELGVPIILHLVSSESHDVSQIWSTEASDTWSREVSKTWPMDDWTSPSIHFYSQITITPCGGRFNSSVMTLSLNSSSCEQMNTAWIIQCHCNDYIECSLQYKAVNRSISCNC